MNWNRPEVEHGQHWSWLAKEREEKHPNKDLAASKGWDPESERRNWQLGLGEIPAFVRAVMAIPNWAYRLVPYPPVRWTKPRHQSLKALVTRKRIKDPFVLALHKFMRRTPEGAGIYTRDDNHETSWFHAPPAFHRNVREANVLQLWPTEVANLWLPPALQDDPDVLAITAWCQGIRGRLREDLLVNVSYASMRRGLEKISADTSVRVALAAPHVRYLNAVELNDYGFAENIAAVKRTMERPMQMTQAERDAWENSAVLEPALREAIGLRHGRQTTRTYAHGWDPKAWPKGWRMYNLTVWEGYRFGHVPDGVKPPTGWRGGRLYRDDDDAEE